MKKTLRPEEGQERLGFSAPSILFGVATRLCSPLSLVRAAFALTLSGMEVALP